MQQSFTFFLLRPDSGKIIAQYKRGERPAMVQVLAVQPKVTAKIVLHDAQVLMMRAA